MPNGIEVSAVMPCLNEEQTVGICIEKAQRCFRELGIRGEVVVCDNGSTDSSVSVVERLGARVVRETTPGYGAALMRGIEAARGEIVIIADSDDSYDWLDLAGYVHEIRAGYDLVVGDRFAGGIEAGAMPLLHRYLGNPVLSFLARFCYRTTVRDFHCGMRAFTKSAYGAMKLKTTGMEFATEMIANAALQGLRIGQVPVKLRPDGRNRPPHLRSFRDGWRHLRFIFTYAPDHLYLLPGGLLLLIGFLLSALLAPGPVTLRGFYLGIHFLALGCMLVLTGFNIVTFGVFAKVIISRDLTSIKSRLVKWSESRFSLERGLIAGGAVLLPGLAEDFFLLYRWIGSGRGPMGDSSHSAFVATTLITLGLNIMLSSFLLNLLLIERRRPARPAPVEADSQHQPVH
jgi:hypothetical protein